jgi:hypothetical protein
MPLYAGSTQETLSCVVRNQWQLTFPHYRVWTKTSGRYVQIALPRIIYYCSTVLTRFSEMSNHGTVQELAAITDEHVENTLRTQDASEGKWLDEDPPLSTVIHILQTRH